MAINASADVNTLPVLSLPGAVDVLRESDQTHFRGVLRREEQVSQNPGALIQVGNWTLVTQASVRLDTNETLTVGTRRYKVEYVEDDEMGMLVYVLAGVT